jgi:UrcA family protein
MTNFTRTPSRLLSLGLLVVAGAILFPPDTAHAASRSGDPHSVTVRFSDLDLNTAQGTATLYARIRNAARTVCGPVDIGLVEEKQIWDHCVDWSLAAAVAKLANAKLTAYYLARTRSRHAVVAADIAQAGHAS